MFVSPSLWFPRGNQLQNSSLSVRTGTEHGSNKQQCRQAVLQCHLWWKIAKLQIIIMFPALRSLSRNFQFNCVRIVKPLHLSDSQLANSLDVSLREANDA
jgi:hypothetical protein